MKGFPALKSALEASKAPHDRLHTSAIAIEKALAALKPAEGVVIEGTSVLKYIEPNLDIYLKDQQKGLRPEAKQARKKADLIINVQN